MNELIRKLPLLSEPFEYVAHEIADQFPVIEGVELEKLKASVKANGILQPVVLWNDGSGLKILDGRNRWAAAKAVGHKFTLADFTVFHGTSEDAERHSN